MATYSSILVWEIPWTEKSGRLQPMRPQSQTLLSGRACSMGQMPKSYLENNRNRPTPVLLPGKSHGWRSLVGCSPWGRQESDTTERLLSLFTFMHGRRKWQRTPVFLPGESQGRGSLVGCRLWGCTESDTTEATQQKRQEQKQTNICDFKFQKQPIREEMITFKGATKQQLGHH